MDAAGICLVCIEAVHGREILHSPSCIKDYIRSKTGLGFGPQSSRLFPSYLGLGVGSVKLLQA